VTRDKGGGLENASGTDYAALVVMVTVGIVACALFIAWALEKRGVLAPGTSPVPTGLADDGAVAEDAGGDFLA